MEIVFAIITVTLGVGGFLAIVWGEGIVQKIGLAMAIANIFFQSGYYTGKSTAKKELQKAAIEHNVGRYLVDTEGSTTFTWIKE